MSSCSKIFLIFFFSFFVIFLWWEIYLPVNYFFREEKIFLIKKGESLFQIAENLEKEGLIKNKFLFDLYIFIKGAQRKLQAGEYSLTSSESINRIAEKIISGYIAKIVVTIPEGWTQKQIEEMIGLKLPGENLEGFLFPDTYQFPLRVSGEEVVKKMRDNFDKKLTPDLKKEIQRQGKTISEIITMASLIEKEVSKNEDKELVSGILWKRLKNNIPLQVDATITYITGKRTTKISKEETQIDSPYNTYKYLGFPPGPICNPGIDSIKAAIYPKNSEYWYYLSTPEGKTIFSKTLEEHNIAKEKYLR
ncbi:MAG: endolytic transglycosylase MltG [Candidatus Nealsonbacteria bacterium CG02_land_8_20_14_3_00_40_11]|uniref:Endolytic murein transglycosylase n=1 Tax=Candidatus Nealsonbacteria bacterium CG02_land_8_20_14_3_00_40_11 TaxID=1974700 RepID=A0A2M7D811_9BACT|nr:MAG: endolytic transglycosylase MltG [Candidatus Nealsonbacteria bacterium CG02_land_8_20_14_3_00_40_11]